MATAYSQRLHAFTPTKTWTLTPEGVSWSVDDADKETGFIPLNTIQKVRLRYEPSRAERRRIGLHIYAPNDHHITNIDYQGPLKFEPQPDEFRNFVMDFHALFPQDTKTTFHSGSTMGAYIGNAVLTVFILGLLLFIAPILSITGIPAATTIGRILILLFFAPTLIRLLIKNRPMTYRPDAVPEHLVA